MSEKFQFPAAEYYELPRNPYQQADEELQTYQTSAQMRANLAALNIGYRKAPCLRSMKRFAEYAAVVRSPESRTGSDGFNGDFYSGALMAVHVNVAPAPANLRRFVLSHDFTEGIANQPNALEIEYTIRQNLLDWAGYGDDNWEAFLSEQPEDYQNRVLAFSQRIYADRDDAPEREFDFVLGYTFASDYVWSAAKRYQTAAPVV